VSKKPDGNDVEDAIDDATKQAELAKAIEKLTPEEAAYFLFTIETKLRARKLQLLGYLIGIVIWLAGMFFALVYYGLAEGFAGWVFLVPFAAFGGILYGFGKWSDRVSKRKPPPDIVVTG
jgi:hypothetical protein